MKTQINFLLQKKFMYVLLILVGWSCVNDKKKEEENPAKTELTSDLSELRLKGEVKAVKTAYFEAVKRGDKAYRGQKPDEVEDYQIRFNKQGNKEEEAWFDVDGNLSYKVVYRNNDIGLPEERRAYYDAEDQELQDSIFYNPQYQITEIRHYDDRGEFTRTVYKYDQKGHQKEQIYYDLSGKTDQKTVFEYDERGNRTGEAHLNEQGVKVLKRTFNFNEEKQITGISEYDRNNRLIHTIEMDYDINGYITTEKFSDKEGNLVQQKNYLYEYDNCGNWVRQTVFENDNPQLIVERTLSYY